MNFNLRYELQRKKKLPIAPGVKVRIMTWEAMVRKYGLNAAGRIDCKFEFPEQMRSLCETEYVVSNINDSCIYFEGVPLAETTEDGTIRMIFGCGNWVVSRDMIETI